MHSSLPLGSCLGIVGGGQLGRMLVMDARRMGYRTAVFDPAPDCPAGQVADSHTCASYDDQQALKKFATQIDAATFEFEHVSRQAIEIIGSLRPIAPGLDAFLMKQDRVHEKDSLARPGFGVAKYRPVSDINDLHQAVAFTGLPAVLKSTANGYDGKGQTVIEDAADLAGALERLAPAGPRFVLEEFVPFDKELSVICARDAAGRSRCFPVVENIHRNGVLDLTIAPARVPLEVAARARALAESVAQRLQVVGLLASELFLRKDGSLLINELAFRPHNSGHYTIEACATSQFEQLVRVLAGLPLGSTELLRPAVMANLLGDLWVASRGLPNVSEAMEVPGVRLHLYGKAEARPGRKMGHLTAVAHTVEAALERAVLARERFGGSRVAPD